jgi:hypothetical protein
MPRAPETAFRVATSRLALHTDYGFDPVSGEHLPNEIYQAYTLQLDSSVARSVDEASGRSNGITRFAEGPWFFRTHGLTAAAFTEASVAFDIVNRVCVAAADEADDEDTSARIRAAGQTASAAGRRTLQHTSHHAALTTYYDRRDKFKMTGIGQADKGFRSRFPYGTDCGSLEGAIVAAEAVTEREFNRAAPAASSEHGR